MMKNGKRETRRTAKPEGATHVFRLFVVGNECNSAQAKGNLAQLCEEHLKGRYRIETVDVLKNTAAAHKDKVLVTPTLLLLKPTPKVTVFGNLSDTKQVLAALRLIGNGQ